MNQVSSEPVLKPTLEIIMNEEDWRAYERIHELETAIRKHRDAKGHDRCWLDDIELYKVLGEESPDLSLPPKDEFLRECEKYYECRRTTA